MLILFAELFIKSLKESCFLHCWKVLSVVTVFRNVGERPTAKKNYPLVSILSFANKIFEDFVNNRLVDHFENYGLFSISSIVASLVDQL